MKEGEGRLKMMKKGRLIEELEEAGIIDKNLSIGAKHSMLKGLLSSISIVSCNRIIHISTKVYSILCIMMDLIIFNKYIVAIQGTYYAASIIIIHCIISYYHIMCSCMWVKTIVSTITYNIVLNNHMTYAKSV